jgi:hypothetical protein
MNTGSRSRTEKNKTTEPNTEYRKDLSLLSCFLKVAQNLSRHVEFASVCLFLFRVLPKLDPEPFSSITGKRKKVPERQFEVEYEADAKRIGTIVGKVCVVSFSSRICFAVSLIICVRSAASERLAIGSPHLALFDRRLSPACAHLDAPVRKLLERRGPEIQAVVERLVKELCGRSPSDVRSRGPYMEQQLLIACSALLGAPTSSACHQLISFLGPVVDRLLRVSHVSDEIKREASSVLDMLQSVADMRHPLACAMMTS